MGTVVLGLGFDEKICCFGYVSAFFLLWIRFRPNMHTFQSGHAFSAAITEVTFSQREVNN